MGKAHSYAKELVSDGKREVQDLNAEQRLKLAALCMRENDDLAREAIYESDKFYDAIDALTHFMIANATGTLEDLQDARDELTQSLTIGATLYCKSTMQDLLDDCFDDYLSWEQYNLECDKADAAYDGRAA